MLCYARSHRAIAVLPDYHLNTGSVGTKKRAAELGLKDSKQVFAPLSSHACAPGVHLVTARQVPDDVDLLRRLADEDLLMLSPPQDYDDSYAIQLAKLKGGCIMSDDMYRDYEQIVDRRGGNGKDAHRWLRKHLISFTFWGDELVPNPDFVFPPA